MTTAQVELDFSQLLIADYSEKCASYIQSVYEKLAEIPNIDIVRPQVDVYRAITPPLAQPLAPAETAGTIASSAAASKPPAKHPYTPSPSKRSPMHKKPSIRAPFKEISNTEISYPHIPSSNWLARMAAPTISSSRKGSPVRSPEKSPARVDRSPVRSARSPERSPVRASRQPVRQLERSPSRPQPSPTRTSARQALSQTSATPAKPLKLASNCPAQEPNNQSPASFKLNLSSRIPVRADTTIPTSTPFRIGLKKPLPPAEHSIADHFTLPEISDNGNSPSLLRSWAATPETVRQVNTQFNTNPHTIFGTVQEIHPESIFKKKSLRPRARKSSAMWEADGLTQQERDRFAKENFN